MIPSTFFSTTPSWGARRKLSFHTVLSAVPSIWHPFYCACPLSVRSVTVCSNARNRTAPKGGLHARLLMNDKHYAQLFICDCYLFLQALVTQQKNMWKKYNLWREIFFSPEDSNQKTALDTVPQVTRESNSSENTVVCAANPAPCMFVTTRLLTWFPTFQRKSKVT